MTTDFIIKCPHCHGQIQISSNQINCKIFRHAVYKHNLEPINPHATQQDCETLVKEEKIYGCGKPFYFDGTKLEKCEYI